MDTGRAYAAGLAQDVEPGFSPDIMADYAQQFGGMNELMEAVQAARAGEAAADPRLTSLTPEQRAALDRYTNFAAFRKESGGGAIPFLGGLGLMAATEGFKMIPGADRAASAVWNRLKGTPKADSFFGGKDQSKPGLQNLAAAYYGWKAGK